MKRYKLNSEKLKQCFYRHHKTFDKSWRNYAQELYSYFTEWITELDVQNFQQLKDLIVTEQLKFRVPIEVRDHFLEDWLKIKTPFDLAEKLDDYESIRESFKRRYFQRRISPEIKLQLIIIKNLKKTLKILSRNFKQSQNHLPTNSVIKNSIKEKLCDALNAVPVIILDLSVTNLKSLLKPLLHMLQLGTVSTS